MVVTEEGIVIDLSEQHPENNCLLMDVIEEGIVTDSREEHP